VADRIELVDASGPVSPRFHHATTIVIEASDGGGDAAWTRDHRDAAGATRATGTIARAAFDALVTAIAREVAPGTTLDLVGAKRGNVGVAFNHVEAACGGATTRVDYLPSHVDAQHGDARVIAIVAAIRAAVAP
jgi:hypothetical protein